MELKVVCQCGQKYKFDVEPVGGRMPFTVNCPVCNLDGTATANAMLAQSFAYQPSAPVATIVPPPPPISASPPPPPAPSGRLRLSRTDPSAATPTATPPPLPPPVPSNLPGAPRRQPAAKTPAPKEAGEFNLGLGILGAFLGAALGAGLMYGFFALTDFRFPLMGTCIGALTGLGARVLYKGTDMSLGAIAGGIALLATGGTLYFMFGDFAVTFAISMVVSVSLAYKIAG